MPNVRQAWSIVPWLVSAVLAVAYVHQGVQLRNAQQEIEQMRQREQEVLRAKWQLAGHYRQLEVERQQLVRHRREQEQRKEKAAQRKQESARTSGPRAKGPGS
jgi:hypothetical protein